MKLSIKLLFAKSNYLCKKISLADKFLLIILAILFIQTSYHLFFHELSGYDNSSVDVIIRTTTAAIFGYFIGGGFLKDSDDKKQDRIKDENTERIYSKENECKHNQQITIVAIFGILSLLVLIIVNNNVETLPPQSLATISQFRDFVSASIGLLIGHSGKIKI